MKATITQTKWALLAATLLVTGCAKSTDNKTSNDTNLMAGNIVGGVESTSSFQKANGVVALIIKSTDGEGICSGTLISKKLVLTAAHCLDSSDAKILSIRVIFSQNVETATDKEVRHAVRGRVHNQFLSSALSGKGSWNDIALLKLNADAPIDFSFARLPFSDTLTTKTLLIQSGFGKAEATRTPATDTSGVLRQVSGIELLEKSPDNKELLLKENGKGSCNGDSGGPAYVKSSDGRLTQVGINSRGTEADSCIGKGIFTNVAAHMQWIQTNAKVLMSAN